MRNFDASYDMNKAAARRNEILDATPGEQQWQRDARDAKVARSRRYVELRLAGVSQNAAFDQVFDELATAGMVRRNFEITAYDDEDTVSTLDELREQFGL